MSSHAHHSHPDRDEHLSRQSRVEYLRELQERLAAIPDPLVKPTVRCQLCGHEVSITLGRASGVWMFQHRPVACSESGNLTRIDAPDRETAIAKFFGQ